MTRYATHGVLETSTVNRGATALGYCFGRLTAIVMMGALTTGCSLAPPPSYPSVPMHEAVGRVNENNVKLASAAGGLKGSPVDVRGRLRERKGARAQEFSVSGVLGFHRPRGLILQLREGLGGNVVMQAGSNDDEYWLWVKPEIDTLWWGTHAETAFRPQSLDAMPIRPDDLIEVLGLGILPSDATGPDGPVYRPKPNRNALIFLKKEYHLDRAAPYLVREIIFREPNGRERMHAVLSEHRSVRGSNALAAHKIRVEWPSLDSWLELRIRRFTLDAEPFRSPENPRTLGVTVRREIRVNSAAHESAEVASGNAM